MPRILAMLLALGAAAAFALPAGAQSDAAGRAEALGHAEALDRALGPNAEPPRPPAITAPAITWPGALPPAWVSGQPYRQQPLLTAVPPGGTISGRRRSTPGGP